MGKLGIWGHDRCSFLIRSNIEIIRGLSSTRLLVEIVIVCVSKINRNHGSRSWARVKSPSMRMSGCAC